MSSSDANTTQDIERRKLELVEALAAIIDPLQQILSEHKASQLRLAVVSDRLRRVTWLLYAFCGAVALLLAMSLYASIRQSEAAEMQARILDETVQQKELIAKQASKDDVAQVKKKLDEQPTIRVRPASSSDPSASPVVVIETPAPPQSAAPSASASKVEIPVEFPSPSAKHRR
jgi:hypothetical protein